MCLLRNNSNISFISCGVTQGSVYGPLFFLMYINDHNLTIKHCKIHHFANETNLLSVNKSPKHLHKLINIDLKNLSKRLISFKLSLNASKTEITIYRPKRKENELQSESKTKWETTF